MTDPTPTRAEVEAFSPYVGRDAVPTMKLDADLGRWVRLSDYAALRERAEAAEAEVQRLKNIRSAIAEGYNAEAVALEKSVSETLTAQLTAARRAEDAAWNAAIEAAAGVAEQYRDCWPRATAPDAQYELKQEYLHMANGAKIVGQQVRALRRAAPTEGAMRMETGMEHIARDIREGRFPERSEPQMRPAAPTEGEA